MICNENESLYKQCDEMKGQILKSISDRYEDDENLPSYAENPEKLKEAFLEYNDESIEYLKEEYEWESYSTMFEYMGGSGTGAAIAERENKAILHFYEELCSIKEIY